MKFRTQYKFDADPEPVFDAMTDPEIVAHCLPGCKRLEPISADRYKAEMVLGVAAIKGRFKGTVDLLDKNRPHSYSMRVSGRGTAGYAKGQASVEIAPGESGSTVSVVAKVQIGGTVARVGQRLLVGTAKMVSDRFFACLRHQVSRDD